jgi:hypothetical protein
MMNVIIEGLTPPTGHRLKIPRFFDLPINGETIFQSKEKSMLNRFASIALVVALISTSAFANTPSDADAKSKSAAPPSEVGGTAKNEAKPNEKLRADMLKLVADAAAGKVKPAAKSQIQPAKGNNWSTGKKIAVGVGIAVAVVAVILIVRHKVDFGAL